MKQNQQCPNCHKFNLLAVESITLYAMAGASLLAALFFLFIGIAWQTGFYIYALLLVVFIACIAGGVKARGRLTCRDCGYKVARTSP